MLKSLLVAALVTLTLAPARAQSNAAYALAILSVYETNCGPLDAKAKALKNKLQSEHDYLEKDLSIAIVGTVAYARMKGRDAWCAAH
jgi:hypothetical protein